MVRSGLAIAVLTVLVGCTSIPDHRDRPWDPPAGRALFEQLPNWDNQATQTCCLGLVGEDYAAAQCGTAKPVAPWTNRC